MKLSQHFANQLATANDPTTMYFLETILANTLHLQRITVTCAEDIDSQLTDYAFIAMSPDDRLPILYNPSATTFNLKAVQ
jgi:hypothetical protein